MRTLLFTVTAALALSPLAGAASLADAQKLFDQGKWQEAATMAAGLNTASGLALAAQSTTLGASISPEGQRKAMLDKASAYADQALKLDGNSPEANFEKARALGRLVQYNNNILQNLGTGKEIKRLLDKTISLDPKMAGAYVALGLWNAELAAKGGAATLMTGANKNNIVPNFEKAVALEPNNPTHRYEYGNALMILGKSNKAAALAQYQKAASMTGQNFWSKQDAEAAKAKAATLK